jgi:hypothetical protein
LKFMSIPPCENALPLGGIAHLGNGSRDYSAWVRSLHHAMTS